VARRVLVVRRDVLFLFFISVFSFFCFFSAVLLRRPVLAAHDHIHVVLSALTWAMMAMGVMLCSWCMAGNVAMTARCGVLTFTVVSVLFLFFFLF